MERHKVLYRGIEILIYPMQVHWSLTAHSYEVRQLDLYDECDDYDIALEKAKKEIDEIIENNKPR